MPGSRCPLITQRYLARVFAAHAAAALAVLLVLYLVFDLVEVYRMIDAAGGGLWTALQYLRDRAASAFWHVAPAAILIGLTLSLGALARRGELTGLYAAGIGPAPLLVPLLVVAAVGSALTWGVAEVWMPDANRRIQLLVRTAVEAGHLPARRQDHWLRAGDRFVWLRQLGPEIGLAQGVTIFEMGPGFRPIRRIDAAAMRWRDGRWILERATLRSLTPPAPPESRPELLAMLEIPPDRLLAGAAHPDTLTSAEMNGLLDWREREGQDVSTLQEALSRRQSWPLLPILLVLVAAPLGLSTRRGPGATAALGRAIAVGAAFAAVAYVSQALAKSGALPPAATGWLPTGLLGAAGLAMTGHLLWRGRV